MPQPRTTFTLLAALAACVASTASAAIPARKLDKIQHIIVISLENHSFDNLFGTFPGAEGISHAARTSVQLDRDGKAYPTLPVEFKRKRHGSIPNGPFPLEGMVSLEDIPDDLPHRFYQQQEQIDDGKMDHFVSVAGTGLTMGYYDGSKTKLWKFAERYTLADHFFHAAFGGSFLNHMWLACACTPQYEKAPASMRARLDASGKVIKDGLLTPDGYAVNTLYSRNLHPADIKRDGKLLPLLDLPTIGDRLSDADISWAWYAGGWNDARAGKPSRLFQYHHQPFSYFRNYIEGTQASVEHLKDSQDFFDELAAGVLPAVSFFKPIGELNMHPGYASVNSGDEYIANLLDKIEQSPLFASTVVIVTFDENGGYWDHVAPPKIDRWGPGMRVPTIIISPFARKHFIDHTMYDTTSILKFIETRFGLEPLTERDANAHDLSNALQLN